METLAALQSWYASQCNGEWEHQYGVKIETCDNPGWWVKIDLTGTALESNPFMPLNENVDAAGFPKGSSWLHCRVEENIWHGAGDEMRLPEILSRFVTWASAGPA